MTDTAAIDTSTVCAVIVTYQPDAVALNALLDAVTPQVGAVVVVDNASDGVWQQAIEHSRPDVALLRQPCNVGLAVAQNAGIDWARTHGYRHVLLLDQDSEPGVGMVAALLKALQALSTENKVGAVGPRFHDGREDRDAPFVRVGFPRSQKLWCETDAQCISCDFLISSGALIPLDVIDQVGAMDAGLFIDNVDMEWSFRARARGYALYGVCAATMHHHLGDERRALPFGLGKIVVHGPSRLYYMMRNRLRLYGMRQTPFVWIAQDVPRVLVKLLLFGVLIGPRWRNLRFMLRGLWDGLMGRQGACPADLLR
ncbi:glycosyltransferase family 2 protein [Rhodanobacter sp. BL-MT-08]